MGGGSGEDGKIDLGHCWKDEDDCWEDDHRHRCESIQLKKKHFEIVSQLYQSWNHGPCIDQYTLLSSTIGDNDDDDDDYG